MGISVNNKSCYTNSQQPAPNPSPDRWELLEKYIGAKGYALKVRYTGCTNYEGVKVMVYEGAYLPRKSLDPHFQPDNNAPIARFRPDETGWRRATQMVDTL